MSTPPAGPPPQPHAPPPYGPPPAAQAGPPQPAGPPPPYGPLQPPPPDAPPYPAQFAPPVRKPRRWLWVMFAIGLVVLAVESTIAVGLLLRRSGGEPGAVTPPGARYAYLAPDGWDSDYQKCRWAPPWTADTAKRQPPSGDVLTCLHQSDQRFIELFSTVLDERAENLNDQQLVEAVKPALVGNVANPDYDLCGASVTKNTTDVDTLGSRWGSLCLADRLGHRQLAAAQVRFSGLIAVVEVCPAPGKDAAIDDACTYVWNHLRIHP